MAQHSGGVRGSRPMGRYSSEPVRTQHRWFGGFYTGEDREDPGQRAREYAERPHGWGDYEANYGVARGELLRVDAPANHAGKGPKNYRRSDERTREIVCERLSDDPRIDASEIEVRVLDGVLTLSGSVPNRWTKYAAEDLAASLVRDGEIRNELKIVRRDESSRWSPAEWPIGS